MACKTAVMFAAIVTLPVVPADADWVKDSISPHCSEEARNRIAQGTRKRIESSVRRSEAAIEPPAATGDLSCLDGLMDMPLDSFAPSGRLGSLFSGSLDSVIGSGTDSRRICGFAARKWREVTRPVSSPLKILRRGLPPDLSKAFKSADRLGLSGSPDAAARRQDPAAAPPRKEAGSIRAPAAETQKARSGQSGGRHDDPVGEIWKSLYGSEESQ